jgi:hypothetical protein
MSNIEPDHRSPARKQQDEQIAAEPRLDPPQLPADAQPAPVEEHLARHRPHPIAVAGIVENGVARPLDRSVKLPERARVIIVTSQNT